MLRPLWPQRESWSNVLLKTWHQAYPACSSPFRSAMSMLNLYLNRAGKNLPAQRRRILNAAKDELRAAFGRPRKQR